MNREIVECFKAYKKRKVDEYTISLDGGAKIIPHRNLLKKKDKGLYKTFCYYTEERVADILEEANKKEKETGEKVWVNIPTVIVVDDHLIDRLSPDNIDSRYFWKKAVGEFPLFSICGGVPKEHTIDSANRRNIEMHSAMGALQELQDFFNKECENCNYTQMLEIGPGYGNICNLIEENVLFATYHAIDVHPLFDHPRIYQTDGKTIPSSIPTELDLVYSINVFQHLSRKQRSSYYSQIYDRLVPGGMFLFSMFVVTPDNKDWPVWGVRDKDGNCYTQFFRQLTEIDKIEDLKNELESIGFQFENVSLHQDKTNSLMFKCAKL